MRKITNPIVIGIVRRCKPITLLLTTCGSAVIYLYIRKIKTVLHTNSDPD